MLICCRFLFVCACLPVAAAVAEQALKAAESTMTVSEIATHRIFVALLHSRCLRQQPALQQQWLEALDGLGGFVDLIPGRGQGGSSPSEPGEWRAVACCTSRSTRSVGIGIRCGHVGACSVQRQVVLSSCSMSPVRVI